MQSKHKRFFAAGIVILVAIRAYSGDAQTSASEKEVDRLAVLRQELSETLQLEFEERAKEVNAGDVDFVRLVRVNSRWHRAWLRSAPQKDVPSVLESYVRFAKDIERSAKLAKKKGDLADADMLAVKAGRIAAELERGQR